MTRRLARPDRVRAELARIDRDRAETRQLAAESEKFIAEQRKLLVE